MAYSAHLVQGQLPNASGSCSQVPVQDKSRACARHALPRPLATSSQHQKRGEGRSARAPAAHVPAAGIHWPKHERHLQVYIYVQQRSTTCYKWTRPCYNNVQQHVTCVIGPAPESATTRQSPLTTSRTVPSKLSCSLAVAV